MSHLWSYFGKIVVLTIPNSKRIPMIKSQLKYIGIINYDIETFTPAKKIKNNGTDNITFTDILKHKICDETCQNIAKNHFTIIQDAYDANLENILIIEDDAEFHTITSDQLYKTIAWLSNHRWDMFYFGYCPWPKLLSIPVSLNIVRVLTPLTTVCYAVSRRGMKKILDNKKGYDGGHIDKFYASHANLEKYAIFPAIVFQSDAPGLYQSAMKKLYLNISFTKLSKVFEVISVITPILIIFTIIFLIYKIKIFLI